MTFPQPELEGSPLPLPATQSILEQHSRFLVALADREGSQPISQTESAQLREIADYLNRNSGYLSWR